MSSLAGSFLVAQPSLQDSNFRQAVVLLLEHGEAGAFGLVVNRPATVVKPLPFPLFVGGPCPTKGLMLLHGQEEWAESSSEKSNKTVAPGIFLGDADCLVQATKNPENARFRVLTGYAGWGPSQLEGELAAGAWAVVSATSQILFETPVVDLWEYLVPPRIPQPSLN